MSSNNATWTCRLVANVLRKVNADFRVTKKASRALVDQAREEGRVLGVEQAADEWRSKLDQRSHHKGMLDGEEVGYKEGFDAGKEEGFKIGFKSGQSETDS